MKNIGDFIPIIGPIVNLIYYYMTSKPIYLIIVFLLLIEIHIISHLYKYIFYKLGLGSLRPRSFDKKMSDDPLRYNGMPSGHTSNVTLFALLYWYTNKSLLFIPLIPIMMAQRIITGAHTLLQTIVGLIVGIIEYLLFVYIYQNIVKR
jgi:membrane-associated phospholipid phosphatase